MSDNTIENDYKKRKKLESSQYLLEVINRANKEELSELMRINFGENTQNNYSSEELAIRIRYNGSNNIAYWKRGGVGVHYLEIVQDVAKKFNIHNVTDNYDIEMLEVEIFEAIMQQVEKDINNGSCIEKNNTRIFDKDNIIKKDKILKKQLLKNTKYHLILPLLVAGGLGLLLKIMSDPAYEKTAKTVIKIALIRQRIALDAIKGDD